MPVYTAFPGEKFGFSSILRRNKRNFIYFSTKTVFFVGGTCKITCKQGLFCVFRNETCDICARNM